MTRPAFEAAVARFRQVAAGTVDVGDWFAVPGYPPYRRAEVTVRRPADDFVDELRDLGLLAAEHDGYLTMTVFDVEATICVSVSRDLEADEIPADAPAHRVAT